MNSAAISMKTKSFFLLLRLLVAAWSGAIAFAADEPMLLPYQADIMALRARVEAQLKANPNSAAQLAPDVAAAFTTLVAKYAGQPEALQRLAFEEVYFSLNIFKDEAAAKARAEALQRNYPGTKVAELAGKVLHSLTPEGKAEHAANLARLKVKQADAKAKRDSLLGNRAPEIDFIWSTRADLQHLADLRGKVVVLDFWATWCGPCIRSFPQVREEVARFADSPVVFLGVTSLQGKVHNLESKPIDVKDQPEQEYALTADFRKKHEMTWDLAFSKQNVFNPDYGVMGIPFVAIIAPDGKVRHAGLNPLAPDADIQGKIMAILKEFNLPLPAEKG